MWIGLAHQARAMSPLMQTLLLTPLIYLSTFLHFDHFSELRPVNRNSTNGDQIACLILEFETFDHDLLATVRSICDQLCNSVIIFTPSFIYPQINLSLIEKCSVLVIENDKSLKKSYLSQNWLSLITSDYLAVVPDSSRLKLEQSIGNELISQLSSSLGDILLVSVFEDLHQTVSSNKCKYFEFNIKKWTLSFSFNSTANSTNYSCFYANHENFVAFTRTKSLLKLPFPFERPFVKSLSIQSYIANLKVSLSNGMPLFLKGKPLFINEHASSKHNLLNKYRTSVLYQKLGIKKVTDENDSIEWYGCERNTPRCFGTIINDVPDYLVKGRWLPPCCRHHLELTGRYVFALLEKFGVRYWLEGGSLLGAARNGQIIDWDYDIDLGIYREDALKMSILETVMQKVPGFQVEDGQGFVWEKALEGDFIKVHFSRTNRIHVDIFPFVSVNGTMTKESWFEDHPQDMPFPEHFLRPLTRINFINTTVNAPNNIRHFLEMKFGPNSIEEPKYPREIITYATL